MRYPIRGANVARQSKRTYIVAVKRERRDSAPADWVAQVRDIPGVIIRGSANPTRLQVEATDKAAQEIQDRLGTFCHIEAAIAHKPSRWSGGFGAR